MNAPVTKSKAANVVTFPHGVSSGLDFSESDSGISKSSDNGIQSAHKEIPPSETPYEVKDQPILTDQLLWDLDELKDTQLRKAYPSEAGTHGSRQTSLKKQGLEYAPEFKAFRSFLRIVGINPYPGPKGYSLHRIDNDNPMYGPGLVKWASKKEQNNAKGDSISLTIDGVTKPLTEWAEASNQKADTLRKRLKKGWTHPEVVYGQEKPPKQTSAVSATDFNQSSDESLQDSSSGFYSGNQSDLDEYEYLYPRQEKLVNLYRNSLKEYYGETTLKVPKKDTAMLTDIANELTCAGYPEEKALLFIFRFWPYFTSYVCKRNGWGYDPPEVPTIGFMVKAINRIPSFFETHNDKLSPIIIGEIENERLVEERREQEKLNRKRDKFLFKHLKATSEYKDFKARMKTHRKLKSTMDEREWKRGHTNLLYEKEELTQSQELFREALKAWNLKQRHCS